MRDKTVFLGILNMEIYNGCTIVALVGCYKPFFHTKLFVTSDICMIYVYTVYTICILYFCLKGKVLEKNLLNYC